MALETQIVLDQSMVIFSTSCSVPADAEKQTKRIKDTSHHLPLPVHRKREGERVLSLVEAEKCTLSPALSLRTGRGSCVSPRVMSSLPSRGIRHPQPAHGR